MQSENPLIADFVKMANSAAGTFAGMTREARENAREKMKQALGGLDFVLGPIVGTFGLIIAFELLRSIQEYQALLYGALMVLVMLFLPNGVLSLPSLLGRLRRTSR